MQFKFPISSDDIQVLSSRQQLKLKLHSLLRSENSGVKYNIVSRKGKYLYATCKNCKSSLNWKLSPDQNRFILQKFNNKHIHPIKQSWIKNRVKMFIEQLPPEISLKDAKKITVSELSITENMFYYHYQRLKHPQTTFKQSILQFLENKFELQLDPYDQQFHSIPDLLVLVSPLMKKNYQKYGHTVTYDLTYNLIKDDHPSKKKYKLGCILGYSLSRRITPFALTITIEESKEKMYEVFKAFGDIMGKMPQVIISDQSPSLRAALLELKQNRQFLGIHCLDAFHILKNVRKKLKQPNNLKYFRQLIKIQDKEGFQAHLKNVYQIIDLEDIPILTSFIRNSGSYCFSQVQSKFVGLSISDGINQKIHDLIKEKIPYQMGYSQVLNRTVKFLQQLGEKCDNFEIQKSPIQKWIDIPQLKQLRYSMDKAVFSYFLKNLRNIVNLEVNQNEQQSYECYDRKCKTYYTIDLLGEQPSCSCQYMKKSGIVCSHIIKLSTIIRFKIEYMIHERWRISTDYRRSLAINKNIKNKRGRKSRRNMLK